MPKATPKLPTPALSRPVVSLDVAAEMLSVSRQTIYNHVSAGLLQATKVGGRRLVLLHSIQELIDKGTGS